MGAQNSREVQNASHGHTRYGAETPLRAPRVRPLGLSRRVVEPYERLAYWFTQACVVKAVTPLDVRSWFVAVTTSAS